MRAQAHAEKTPMTTLAHDLRIADTDGFYEELIASLRDLSDEQAELFQAKLLLLLANHVGDREVLSEAMRAARRDL
jgi:hypothetical protein